VADAVLRGEGVVKETKGAWDVDVQVDEFQEELLLCQTRLCDLHDWSCLKMRIYPVMSNDM
jgi:hypothetical protein